MRICRLCLYKGEDKQIVSVWENQIEDLAFKIENCVSITITKDDELPPWVCISCVHQVMQWEVFRDTCHKSNKALLNKTDIKKVEECTMTNDSEYTANVTDQKCKLRKSKRILKREKKINLSSNSTDEEKELIKQIILGEEVTEENEDVLCDVKKEDTNEEKEYMDEEKDDDSDYFNPDLANLQFELEFVENSYQCELCIENFNNCFDYLDHQETHDGEFIFECDKCTELFNKRSVLVEHDRNHRTPCPFCGKMILRTSMKLHLIKHTDRHRCTECERRFNSRASLAQHTITVHTNIKEHICEVCGKQFSSQTARRVHMKSHSDERLYPCTVCAYAGRTASAVYVHMSTHSNDLCICNVCSKPFKSTRNLNDHMRRVHTAEKKHQCTYCDKKFVDKYMLKVHLRCHTGVRPYKCHLCYKTFIRSDGLKEHMNTHSRRVLYDCKDCGKKFTTKRGIIRHACTGIFKV